MSVPNNAISNRLASCDTSHTTHLSDKDSRLSSQFFNYEYVLYVTGNNYFVKEFSSETRRHLCLRPILGGGQAHGTPKPYTINLLSSVQRRIYIKMTPVARIQIVTPFKLFKIMFISFGFGFMDIKFLIYTNIYIC
jgi:hypothetical protein